MTHKDRGDGSPSPDSVSDTVITEIHGPWQFEKTRSHKSKEPENQKARKPKNQKTRAISSEFPDPRFSSGIFPLAGRTAGPLLLFDVTEKRFVVPNGN